MRRRARLRLGAGVAVLFATSAILVVPGTRPAGSEVIDGVDFGVIEPGPNDVLVGPTPGATTLQVTLGFARDQAGMEAFARSVSDPASPDYGHYLSVAELADRFGVDQSSWDGIDAYLTARGIDVTLDSTGAFAMGLMSVTQASAIFGVGFNSYNDTITEGGPYTAIFPDGAPSLPAELVRRVNLVRGISQFGDQLPGAPPGAAAPPVLHPGGGGNPDETGTPAGCPDGINFEPGDPLGFTPNQLNTAYGVDALHAAGIDGSGVRVAVAGDDMVAPSDLTVFAQCFGIEAPPFFVTNPANLPLPPQTVEFTGDVEAITAMAPGLERLDHVVAPIVAPEGFDLTFMVWLVSGPLNVDNTGGQIPDVISISMGACEQAWQQQGDLTTLIEFELATGVGAGTNWFFPGGDNGSSDCQGIPFVANQSERATDYPSSSTWVTSVGGTNLWLEDDNTIMSQGVWNDLFFGEPTVGAGGGGGGTSLLWPRPPWQVGPGVPPGDTRVMPDVSFYGAQFPGRSIYFAGGVCNVPPEVPSCWTSFDGTSNSTPMMAGAAALLIQAGRAAGVHNLGFLPPLLFELGRANPDVYRDVTIIDNDIAGIGCCSATPGYDIASGWGTSIVSALAHALGVPTAVVSGPDEVDVGGRATFTAASSSTPGGRLVRYAWDSNSDGTPELVTTTPSAELTFPEGGPTEIELTVTNTLGRTATTRTVVQVDQLVPRFTG